MIYGNTSNYYGAERSLFQKVVVGLRSSADLQGTPELICIEFKYNQLGLAVL
ncbi:hypothetical protein [Nostoc sp. DSM 114161]|uniref:hypothetical protein n=1 Tax=Nostoc sp. DSM 114161 TaxID=3440143 RepID=UPI004045E5F8